MGKGENAGYQDFPVPTLFSKAAFSMVVEILQASANTITSSLWQRVSKQGGQDL